MRSKSSLPHVAMKRSMVLDAAVLNKLVRSSTAVSASLCPSRTHIRAPFQPFLSRVEQIAKHARMRRTLDEDPAYHVVHFNDLLALYPALFLSIADIASDLHVIAACSPACIRFITCNTVGIMAANIYPSVCRAIDRWVASDYGAWVGKRKMLGDSIKAIYMPCGSVVNQLHHPSYTPSFSDFYYTHSAETLTRGPPSSNSHLAPSTVAHIPLDEDAAMKTLQARQMRRTKAVQAYEEQILRDTANMKRVIYDTIKSNFYYVRLLSLKDLEAALARRVAACPSLEHIQSLCGMLVTENPDALRWGNRSQTSLSITGWMLT